MAALTAAQIAEKWARRSAAASVDYIAGVDSVTESPTELAAASQDKMIRNLTAAVDDGSWAASLRRVSLADWKALTKAKGAHWVDGIRASEGKMAAAAAQLIPFISDLRARIAAMPNLTLEDSIARANAWIRGMAEFKLT